MATAEMGIMNGTETGLDCGVLANHVMAVDFFGSFTQVDHMGRRVNTVLGILICCVQPSV